MYVHVYVHVYDVRRCVYVCVVIHKSLCMQLVHYETIT